MINYKIPITTKEIRSLDPEKCRRMQELWGEGEEALSNRLFIHSSLSLFDPAKNLLQTPMIKWNKTRIFLRIFQWRRRELRGGENNSFERGEKRQMNVKRVKGRWEINLDRKWENFLALFFHHKRILRMRYPGTRATRGHFQDSPGHHPLLTLSAQNMTSFRRISTRLDQLWLAQKPKIRYNSQFPLLFSINKSLSTLILKKSR